MLLGLDLGTGSVKALLLSEDGAVVGEGSAPYPVRSSRPGWAESDPEDWWAATVEAAKAAVGGRGTEVRRATLERVLEALRATWVRTDGRPSTASWTRGQTGTRPAVRLLALHALAPRCAPALSLARGAGRVRPSEPARPLDCAGARRRRRVGRLIKFARSRPTIGRAGKCLR